MNARVALLFQAHEWTPIHALRYARLRREIGDRADCFILFQKPHDNAALESTLAVYTELRSFDVTRLERQLGYRYLSERGIVPGCAHFPLLMFQREHRYDYYWQIESDVEYSGDWAELLERTAPSSAACIAAHIRTRSAEPEWIWWDSFVPMRKGEALRIDGELYKAFLPVVRYSAQALQLIDHLHRSGWHGHFEVLIPSALRHAGLEVAELRQFGEFYSGDPALVESTGPRPPSFRWRPPVSLHEFSQCWQGSTLFHPVKGNWTYTPGAVLQMRDGKLATLPWCPQGSRVAQ